MANHLLTILLLPIKVIQQFQFIDKIAKKYKEEVTYHKSFKLFLADNASSVKQAIHCDPFTLTVGGFCTVERSDDFTVDFMNKR